VIKTASGDSSGVGPAEGVHQAAKRNIEVFSELAARHGLTAAGVGWTERSQIKRFSKLVEVGNLHGQSVLDVGCGFGDLFAYLESRGFEVDYTGFEITPAMAAGAVKKYPRLEGRIRIFDVLTEDGGGVFDYVISNGPLNVDLGNNEAVIVRFLQRCWGLARRGVAITMTSGWSRRPRPGTHYYDPAWVVAEAGKLTTNLRLDHTYLPHDFALFLYRGDLYDGDGPETAPLLPVGR